MSLLALAASLSVAQAGIVAEVGPPVLVGTSGTWVRALPTDSGWRLGLGTNGNYHIGDLRQTGPGLADWEFDQRGWSQVTDHGDLKDYNVQICPDGGYYVAASANIVDHNDSAYSWFSDADLNIVANGIIEETVPERAHNDMAAMCSPWGTGAAFGGYSGTSSSDSFFFEQDTTATNTRTINIGERFMMGAGLLADAPTDRIILTTADFDGVLTITTYSPEWAQLDEVSLTVAEPGQRTYWPSGIIRVGQFYMLVMMSTEAGEVGGGDTGNVHLFILTEDFDIEEEHKLTNLAGGWDGAMRPWIARRDDLLIVSYDVDTKHTFQAISLDLSGVEEVDEGFDEDADGSDDDAVSEDGDKGGCSTAAGGTGAAAFALLAVGLVGRRRESSTG